MASGRLPAYPYVPFVRRDLLVMLDFITIAESVSALLRYSAWRLEHKTTMASTIEDGAVATAEQLGSLSLGESVERKDNEIEPTTTNGTPTKKMCSACGRESDTVKMCNGCLCVWYCDKKCQNKHRKEHRKECKRIKVELDKRGGKLDLGTEKDIGPLGKLPPQEECPICMLVLPIHMHLHTHFACCGKTICCGCDHQHLMKSGDGVRTCAFCRTPALGDGEYLVQLRKRVELKDPTALRNLALNYGQGWLGLPLDQDKCVDLLREAADLGCPDAHYELGNFHRNGEMGFEQDDAKAQMHWERAAEGGHILALNNFACMEDISGDIVAAMPHARLSASGGHRRPMEGIISCFEKGFLRHSGLAETLQAFHRSKAEMKSDGRDKFIEHLKKTGEYDGPYEY